MRYTCSRESARRTGRLHDLRRRGAEHAVLPQPGLAAKAAADERRVHLDGLRLEREDLARATR